MAIEVGYIVAALIAGVLIWQATSQLGSKRRTRTSLLETFAIEDIAVADEPFTPRKDSNASLLTPRIEYQEELIPFGSTHSLEKAPDIKNEKESNLEGEVTTLKEVAIERYSVRERSNEKVSECKELIQLIKDLREQYNVEIDDEFLEGPLEGLTLAELDIRQSSLLEVYDKLYQHSFQEQVQKVRREQLEFESKVGEKENQTAAGKLANLADELSNLRREEELYRQIQSSKTTKTLESLDMSNLDVDTTKRITAHYDFYYSRLSEIERLRTESERYEFHTNAILDCDEKEKLLTMVFDGVNTRMRVELEERREKRAIALDLRDKMEQQNANAAELRLEIETAVSTTAIDQIQITGVSPLQENELTELLHVTRQQLAYSELETIIQNCEYVLELDAIHFEGVNEEQLTALIEIRANKRAELVEFAKLEKFEEQYTAYLDSMPGIDDIEELLGIEIENVSESQAQELENLRLSRLDHLEEIERIRIEQEQAENFENLRKQLESAKTSNEVEAIVIEGVNEDQELALTEIKSEVFEILLEDEKVTEYVEKAEKASKSPPSPDNFDFDTESTFRTRVKTLGAKDGLLRLSLLWNNKNDLDLIVRTSKGEIIHRGSRNSSCGGILDLEMNAKPEMSSAMENIVWPNGKIPPEGTYNIFIWHRNRHQKLRRTDPTEYTLRAKVGAEYFQYEGKISYGDNLRLIASIEVPESNTMQNRMVTEGNLYQELRSTAKSAKKLKEFPEIDDELSSLHKVMLERIIEKKTSEIKEKAERRRAEKQAAEYSRIILEIESSMNLDELSAVRYDKASDEEIVTIEKLITKRSKAIESGLKKQEIMEMKQRIQDFKTQINEAKTLVDLSSIIFDDIEKRDAITLQRLRTARRKTLQKKLSTDDVEKDKQDRLHKALNEAYSRGGLQPLPADEGRPSAFNERLEDANAGIGDVQISLLWDNKNDFNVLVITPSQEIIHPRNRKSSDGGYQDIEMNQKGESKEPIENIFWPEGKAPKGLYYIYIHFYKEHQLFRKIDISECRVQILYQGQRTEYAAQMSLSNKLQFITMLKVE
ncbi:MAG: hypothetical protein QF440_04330 [Candidatus Thalassarchaeaceae archaeon]|nr:hypothetical protein [Candidatus Thalassarchaeaceae archaeon]